MRLTRVVCGAVMFIAMGATPSYAWKIVGNVYCDANRNGTVDLSDGPQSGITVRVESTDGTFSGTAATDDAGAYLVDLPDYGNTYVVSIVGSSLPAGAVVVVPAAGSATVSNFDFGVPRVDFLLDSSTCAEAKCWLTGGGAKFSSITGTLVAEKGPQHSLGGNVNPSCSAEPGDGGQWNHIAHVSKLHFLGTAIRVVRCGNVPGIPEGSQSPVTPYNFIEYEGTGTLKGIQGNKDDYGTVTFWARAEDRNEPGSNGAKDGALIDRYYLRVLDSAGAVKLLVDDGAGAPVPITGGNLQIHISSCTQ